MNVKEEAWDVDCDFTYCNVFICKASIQVRCNQHRIYQCVLAKTTTCERAALEHTLDLGTYSQWHHMKR